MSSPIIPIFTGGGCYHCTLLWVIKKSELPCSYHVSFRFLITLVVPCRDFPIFNSPFPALSWNSSVEALQLPLCFLGYSPAYSGILTVTSLVRLVPKPVSCWTIILIPVSFSAAVFQETSPRVTYIPPPEVVNVCGFIKMCVVQQIYFSLWSRSASIIPLSVISLTLILSAVSKYFIFSSRCC